jgi:hypothetical protein
MMGLEQLGTDMLKPAGIILACSFKTGDSIVQVSEWESTE